MLGVHVAPQVRTARREVPRRVQDTLRACRALVDDLNPRHGESVNGGGARKLDEPLALTPGVVLEQHGAEFLETVPRIVEHAEDGGSFLAGERDVLEVGDRGAFECVG
jgi:hypothetical protein